jgi:hypothetical protein
VSCSFALHVSAHCRTAHTTHTSPDLHGAFIWHRVEKQESGCKRVDAQLSPPRYTLITPHITYTPRTQSSPHASPTALVYPPD